MVKAAGGVQSVERAMGLLEAVARSDGGLGLSRLAAMSGLALPTTHRLVRTLVDLGYLRQEPSRAYALGPRWLTLTESTSTVLVSLARPHLSALVDELGETANLARLDGDHAVYVVQVPSRHAMRMFTEVGRRVMLHCTAVGKALAATRPDEQVRAAVDAVGLPAQTAATLTSLDALSADLGRVRERGYALDDGEQEVGVRCVAVAVPAEVVGLALSVSGPTVRMTDELVRRAVPLLREAADALGADLG